jgi:hypothetical protein
MSTMDNGPANHVRNMKFRFEGSNRPVESTLENWNGYVSSRRCGNTTRLVDHAVQMVFAGKIVVCFDHHEKGENMRENQRLLRLVMERMGREHNLFASLKVEKSLFLIYLK